MEKKTWGQLHKNATRNIEQVLEAAPHKAAAVRPPTNPSQKLSKLNEPDMRDTAGEVGTNSSVTYSCGPLYMDDERQDDQTGCSLEDLPGAMNDSEGRQKVS